MMMLKQNLILRKVLSYYGAVWNLVLLLSLLDLFGVVLYPDYKKETWTRQGDEKVRSDLIMLDDFLSSRLFLQQQNKS